MGVGIREDLGLRWNVRVLVLDAATGELIEERRTHNIVTTAGLAEIGRRVALIAPGGEDQMSVGTGTTAVALGDTAMEDAVYTGNVSFEEGGAAGSTFTFAVPSTEANGEDISEIGLLTVDDLLIAHALISPAIAKTSGKVLVLVWQWTFGNVTA